MEDKVLKFEIQDDGMLGYSIKEASRVSSIGEHALRKMAEKGEIKFLKIGNKTLISKRELIKKLESNIEYEKGYASK